MSVSYTTVQWNRHKRAYDALIAAAVALYLGGFVLVSQATWTGREAISLPIMLIRATGTCAFVMLHVILCIGPLARLWPRALPLLYNRRHLGVATFLVGLTHGALNLGFYHGFGTVNPLVSLLINDTQYGSLTGFPFQILGVGALLILFLMAATSHDFWLKNLTPPVWKALHMGVYIAYALLVMHVTLGALQAECSPLYAGAVLGAAALVAALHLVAGRREVRRDAAKGHGEQREQWLCIGSVDEIAENRAKVVCLPGRERIAVFRYEGKVSAISNVCMHQNGPLGEGKIVGGCVTCPWHGYQYRPADGTSPPPFTEKVPTYRVRVEERRVWLDPAPLPPGTPVEPARIEEEAA